MKKTLLTLAAGLFVQTIYAQQDTLLFENFEAEDLSYIEITFPTGTSNESPTWINFDVDGIADGSGADRPAEWFLTFGFADQDSTNTVLASNSWLQGFVDGAENWLISPRIYLGNSSATLRWKSAPFQLPRYMDGYRVMVSTTDNLESSFTELELFAQFDGTNTPDIDDVNTYVFTAGTMHTEMEPAVDDPTRNRGVLQQWEASLDQFAGQAIHIAFVHGSDDDNLLSIDDILVLGTDGTSIADQTNPISGLNAFPTPATDVVNVAYNLDRTDRVSFVLTDLNGKTVFERQPTLQMAGQQGFGIDVSHLANGTYLLQLRGSKTNSTVEVVVNH